MERLTAPLKLSLIQAHLFLGKGQFPILRSTTETKETNKTFTGLVVSTVASKEDGIGFKSTFT